MREIDWDNLPPTTTPQVPVIVKGFSNREAATELGKNVGECVATIGSFMDLSTLDGVTIAIDYDAALAEIDRGMAGLKPLDRTNTEELQGVAKTCQVMRDGFRKSHLVFNAQMLVSLIAGEAATDDDRKSAIGIIAHECGHVQVNAQLDVFVLDARLGAVIADFERAVLFQIANICWDEYAVCRLSAPFAPLQNEQHAATVIAVVPGALERARAHITAYRIHGDNQRIISEAGGELCQPLKAIAYLFGGMDADNLDWHDFPDAQAAVEEAGYAELADALRRHCRSLWESQAEWSVDQDVFAPLIDVAREAFELGGIHFYQSSGEWCISIPFTPETMPDS